jgi:hypothetical protein
MALVSGGMGKLIRWIVLRSQPSRNVSTPQRETSRDANTTWTSSRPARLPPPLTKRVPDTGMECGLKRFIGIGSQQHIDLVSWTRPCNALWQTSPLRRGSQRTLTRPLSGSPFLFEDSRGRQWPVFEPSHYLRIIIYNSMASKHSPLRWFSDF